MFLSGYGSLKDGTKMAPRGGSTLPLIDGRDLRQGREGRPDPPPSPGVTVDGTQIGDRRTSWTQDRVLCPCRDVAASIKCMKCDSDSREAKLPNVEVV